MSKTRLFWSTIYATMFTKYGTATIAWVFISGLVGFAGSKDFTLGVLFPWSGWLALGEHGCGAAAQLAIDDINNDDSFVFLHRNNHKLRIIFADTECKQHIGLPLIPNMYFGKGYELVDAFIGPGCSVICEPGALLVAEWGVPMISWGSTSDKMSAKDLYPTFARTVAPSSKAAPFFPLIMSSFSFYQVAIFYSTDHIQILSALRIKEELTKSGVKVSYFFVFEPGSAGRSQEQRALSEAKRISRGNDVNVIFLVKTKTKNKLAQISV